MADETRDEKREQMEVFEDILNSQYKLREAFHDMVINWCNKVIKKIKEIK